MHIDELFDKVKTLANKLGPEHVVDLYVCLELLEVSLRYRLRFREQCNTIAYGEE